MDKEFKECLALLLEELRRRGDDGDLGTWDLNEFIRKIITEIESKLF